MYILGKYEILYNVKKPLNVAHSPFLFILDIEAIFVC